jgi:hypothetical protein
MLVVAAVIFVACAPSRSRSEQPLLGFLVMGAAFANAFVYPYARELLDLSWTPASAVVYLLALPAIGVVLHTALAERSVVLAGDSGADARAPDFGFRDVAVVISAVGAGSGSDAPAVPPWTRRALAWATGVVGVIFFVPAAFVAVVLPYRYWDSLAFGSWSRSIAEGKGLWQNASVFELSRPAFYVRRASCGATCGRGVDRPPVLAVVRARAGPRGLVARGRLSTPAAAVPSPARFPWASCSALRCSPASSRRE